MGLICASLFDFGSSIYGSLATTSVSRKLNQYENAYSLFLEDFIGSIPVIMVFFPRFACV